jgi:cytochrome d ubiquinol oxidase subunit II
MPLERVLAIVMVAGLVLYLLGGGADFGGGVWDLLASGPRKNAQRALIEKAIGPIWEANHVWFIFVFVLLFSAFPPAFATLTTALFTPLTLYALGLVMRGAAFTFRHYDADPSRRRRFGALFSAASVGCPFILGAMGAALVREQPLSWSMDVFVVAAGLFTLALVAALAATYLTVEAADAALREDFRRRALGSLAVAGLASFVALGTAEAVAPTLIASVGHGGPVVVGALFGGLALFLVATRRYRSARLVVGALASTVVIGWAVAKGEVLVWGEHTLTSSHAQPSTMVFLLAATVIAAVLVGPSLVFLFSVFARPSPRARRPAGAPRPSGP